MSADNAMRSVHRGWVVVLTVCAVLGAWSPAFAQRSDPRVAEILRLYRRAEALKKAAKYADSARLYEQVVQKAKTVFGLKHRNTATLLNNLAHLYTSMGAHAKAEPLYRKALEVWKKALGEQHPTYATGLNNLAWLYRSMGAYAKAEPLFRQALEVRKKALGEQHPDYAASLSNLAGLYSSMGAYAKAEPLYRQCLEIDRKALGERHPSYAIDLNNLAALYKALGAYAKAEPLYRQCLEINRKALGQQHPSYARGLNNLAGLYSSMGAYAKAEPLFRQALELKKKTLGEQHPSYATGLNNLAGLYRSMGAYAKAEPLYRKALGIRKKALGEQHPDYAESLNNLAALYESMGAYAKAEPLLRQALEINRKALGEQHPGYATSLGNLAVLYSSMGAYAKAEPLFRQALEIHRRALGEQHPEYARILSNLARLYESMGTYTKAEPLYRQALEIRKNMLGEQHPTYATSLDDLAGLYRSMGAYAKAEPLYRQALEISRTALGERHPSYATGLNNLAGLYVSMGAYVKAEPLLCKALEINRKALGEQHPSYATGLRNLACLRAAQGRFSEALGLSVQAAQVQERIAEAVFAVSSEQRLMAFLKTMEAKRDGFLTLCIRHMPHSERARAAALDLLLRRTGMALDSLAAGRRAARLSQDPAAGRIARKLLVAKSELANLVFRGPRKEGSPAYRRRLKELGAEVEELEAELARTSAAFRGEVRTRNVDVKQLASALPGASAFVQFAVYDVLNFRATGKRPRWVGREYAALVLLAGRSAPALVRLGDADKIERAVRACAAAMENVPGLIRQGKEPEADRRASAAGAALRKLVWDPVAAELGGARRVYVCPDGEISFVSFSALPLDKGRYVLDAYDVTVVSSGRDLLRERARGRSDVAAFGGPTYGGEPVRQQELAFTRGTFKSGLEGRGVLDSLKRFPPLPGARAEALAAARAARAAGMSCRLYVGDSATEYALKATRKPGVLYLATHGFFLPESGWFRPDEKGPGGLASLGPPRGADPEALKKNPMLRSGLALAGANRALEGKAPPDTEDGIVTAEEVAGLDLEGTGLVVLSACSTALGEARAGEGVLGLRRAFVTAGAQNLVMTLWSVPDQATRELLGDFFGRYVKTKDADRSLRDAQRAYLKRARRTGRRANPFFWAAFVNTGLGLQVGVGEPGKHVPTSAKPRTARKVPEVPERRVTFPRGTTRRKRVKVLTPKGEQWRKITYYRNPLGMEFVEIPLGEFPMGSPSSESGRDDDEGPVHKVRIAKPFFLGAYEVTQRQWEQVMGNNPSHFRGGNRPVERVSWHDAQEFIRKLCAKEHVGQGTYRLPTEAEWEYACRAGSRTRFYSGDDDPTLSRIAWHRGSSHGRTHEVGRKLPNAFGLHDMSGNVWEWCQDWHDSGYYARSPVEAPGPDAGFHRVARGGNWLYAPKLSRSANRFGFSPDERIGGVGFRVARSAARRAPAPTLPGGPPEDRRLLRSFLEKAKILYADLAKATNGREAAAAVDRYRVGLAALGPRLMQLLEMYLDASTSRVPRELRPCVAEIKAYSRSRSGKTGDRVFRRYERDPALKAACERLKELKARSFSEGRKLLRSFLEKTEAYSTELAEASNGKEAAAAVDRYRASLVSLGPEFIELVKRYPSLSRSRVPTALQACAAEIEAFTESKPGRAAKRVLRRYERDPDLKAAAKRLRDLVK